MRGAAGEAVGEEARLQALERVRQQGVARPVGATPRGSAVGAAGESVSSMVSLGFKTAQHRQHIMVVSRRNGPAAGDPGQDVGVALIEQRLELAELGLVHGRDVGSREAADKEVGLELAAVAAAVQQALPAGLGGLGQGGSKGRCCDDVDREDIGIGR